jgi:hypothetical protein
MRRERGNGKAVEKVKRSMVKIIKVISNLAEYMATRKSFYLK